jgi:hypothetical protein
MTYSVKTRQQAAMLCSAMASDASGCLLLDVAEWLRTSQAAMDLVSEIYWTTMWRAHLWPMNGIIWGEAECKLLEGWRP